MKEIKDYLECVNNSDSMLGTTILKSKEYGFIEVLDKLIDDFNAESIADRGHKTKENDIVFADFGANNGRAVAKDIKYHYIADKNKSSLRAKIKVGKDNINVNLHKYFGVDNSVIDVIQLYDTKHQKILYSRLISDEIDTDSIIGAINRIGDDYERKDIN